MPETAATAKSDPKASISLPYSAVSKSRNDTDSDCDPDSDTDPDNTVQAA